MRFLKNFNIWWGWFLNKHRKGWGVFFVMIIMIFFAVGAVAFFLSFILNEEQIAISPIKIRIIALISTLIGLYLNFGAFIYSYSDKNFRIAIDEAKKFTKKNPQCLSKINLLVQETKETKNPAKINEWIKNWTELSSQKVGIQELKKKREDIEKEISLKEVNVEIEARQKEINELESKLA